MHFFAPRRTAWFTAARFPAFPCLMASDWRSNAGDHVTHSEDPSHPRPSKSVLNAHDRPMVPHDPCLS